MCCLILKYDFALYFYEEGREQQAEDYSSNQSRKKTHI